MSQMKKVWALLRNGLGVSDEERKILVKGCLNNLLEVCRERERERDRERERERERERGGGGDGLFSK